MVDDCCLGCRIDRRRLRRRRWRPGEGYECPRPIRNTGGIRITERVGDAAWVGHTERVGDAAWVSHTERVGDAFAHSDSDGHPHRHTHANSVNDSCCYCRGQFCAA